MSLVLAIAAVITSTPHVIEKAFGVALGQPAGDMQDRGFRPNEFGGSNSWVKTDDPFFDRVTVEVSQSLSLVASITVSKRYGEGDRELRARSCEADLESVTASVRAKYPTLRKPSWHKTEDGLAGMLGYYKKYILSEPASHDADPSPSRYIRLVCTGPSALARSDDANKPTIMLVSYEISEKERVPIERAFRSEEQRRERTRARAIGVDPKRL